MRAASKPGELGQALRSLHARFGAAYVETDPVAFVHQARAGGAGPEELELVAFYAAALAYGGVKIIRASLADLFSRIGLRPRRFILEFEPDSKAFDGFAHRFHKGPDLALLTWLLRQALLRHGTLERLFLAGDDPAAPDLGPALGRFVAELLSGDCRPFHASLPARAPVRHFLPSPEAGSACKRLCLFLRWVVRREAPDLGLWQGVAPARLIVPLDTHVTRIARYLGLASRQAGDWKTAQQVSASLRRLEPDDPIRYDFPLAHLGIHHCRHRPDPVACPACPVRAVCSLANPSPTHSRKP